jgi:hypothetical protein
MMTANPTGQYPRSRRATLLAGLILAALFSGCAVSENVQTIDKLESVAENPRVIMMPPDIKYYLLTAGGVPEPHKEWTEAAQANFTRAMTDFAASMGSDLTFVDPDNVGDVDIEYETLHSAVGMTILRHHFGYLKLPSKGNGEIFDWSLGPGVKALADKYDADYGLFVFYRDYQASGGRVAFAILAAAAVGAAVPMGAEQGFASLVDLRSGDIVWFNVVGSGSGEMRDEKGAVAAVNTLFRDIPTNKPPVAEE